MTLELDLGDALARGETLPAAWYRDDAVLEREQEVIFASAWQYAGRADLVAEPGQYFTCFAAHVPVVVVRDRSGALNGFVNVCRHRGHLVADGVGKRETLQCPYHAWTYGLDGCLRTAPRADREADFDASRLSLLPVQVDVFGPLVFVNPDPDASSFADTYPELPARVAESGVDLADLEFRSHRDRESPVNWKLGVENYLEFYHRQLHFLWPNTGFRIEPGARNFAVMSWQPVTPRLTHERCDYFFGPEVSEAEAQAVVQRALDSRLPPHGQVLPRTGRLTARFQRLVHDAVA